MKILNANISHVHSIFDALAIQSFIILGWDQEILELQLSFKNVSIYITTKTKCKEKN